MEMQLKPIGIIHTPFQQPAGTPIQSAAAVPTQSAYPVYRLKPLRKTSSLSAASTFWTKHRCWTSNPMFRSLTALRTADADGSRADSRTAVRPMSDFTTDD
jgi:tRNA (Thr-GGU) A37 N-methylase